MLQTQLFVDAQVRQRPDGTVGILGEAGHVIFGGMYADTVWADYQKALRNASGKIVFQILIEVEAMEPY